MLLSQSSPKCMFLSLIHILPTNLNALRKWKAPTKQSAVLHWVFPGQAGKNDGKAWSDRQGTAKRDQLISDRKADFTRFPTFYCMLDRNDLSSINFIHGDLQKFCHVSQIFFQREQCFIRDYQSCLMCCSTRMGPFGRNFQLIWRNFLSTSRSSSSILTLSLIHIFSQRDQTRPQGRWFHRARRNH